MTESEIKAYISSEIAAQLQAMNTKDIASETDIPTLSDAEWDTNNALTSMPVVYNGSTWRKIGLSFLRTLRNAAAVINTAWNSLKNNGTSVSWIPTVDTSGNAGKTSPADLAAVLGGLPYKGDASSGSPDTATVQGVYYALIPFMQKTGIHSEGLFCVYRPITDTANVHNTCCIQIFVSYDGVLFKRRIYNWDSQIWTEWKDI